MQKPGPISTSKHERGAQNRARINSIRVDLMKLNALLDLLDAKDGQHPPTNRRYVRWPFRHLSVPLTVVHVGGCRATIGVACRNISCGGLSVLHNSYVYPGRACELQLPHVSGQPVDVAGKIKRCNHLSGIVHEVGIEFDKPIRIGDFVNLGPNAAAFSLERVDPQTLRGVAIVVGGSALDHQMITHHLRETQMAVRTFSDAQEAITRMASGVDLVILDAGFDAECEPTFVTRLRAAGIIAPVLGVVSGSATRPSAAKADAFICRPITAGVLLQAMAEFLSMEDGKGLFVSSLPPHHPTITLVDSFVEEVKRQADALEEAIRSEGVDACLEICQQIAGIAPVVGFDALSTVAQQAHSAAQGGGSVQGALGELRRLVTCCRRIKKGHG